MTDLSNLRRRQLDRALLRPLGEAKVPRQGWIREIRKTLGMTVSQLGARMGIAQSNASRLEKSEGDGGVTLRSMKRAAEAMDCQLVYFFVPNQESFEALLERRIQAAARRELERLKHTMALEDQAVLETDERDLLNQFIQQISSNPSELWDDVAEPHEHP